jgi:hypothetical protein
MDSPPSSRLRFLAAAEGIGADGTPVDAPREWSPGFVEVLVPINRCEEVRLWRQGEELPVYLKRLGGQPRILADWPRSGAGRYRLRLECLGATEERIVSVGPEKLTSESYARLLEDLESRLPVSVAVGLQRTGALSGIAFRPPTETTLAEEANRLKRAVAGTAGRPGLSKVLVELARRPHVILRTTEPWVLRHEARRPHPARLVQAISLTGNLAEDHLPERVLDTRVEHTANVYENRLVKSYAYQVELRLRRLIRALQASPPTSGAQGRIRDQERELRELLWARRQAAFLDEVELLAHLPTRLTMVLRRRPPYRAALEGYLEFRRNAAVRLEEPNLDAPLENLPSIYQTWGTLEVISALLSVASELGYVTEHQQLVDRDAGGYYVRVLPGGSPALLLVHTGHGTVVRLIPERSYAKGSGRLRSISFTQRPDVTIEIRPANGPPRLYLFDSKYKLDGELAEGESADGKPKKVDIDKMHAYRDSIRNEEGERVVRYAAVLYPGPKMRYGEGLEAVRAFPGSEEDVENQLEGLLREALSP